MTHEQLNKFRDNNTREIDMPDGSKQVVRMTPELWNSLEFIQVHEGLTTAQIVTFAQEEMALQDVTFDRAFRGIVAHFANLWT